jgi:hypothetical protein
MAAGEGGVGNNLAQQLTVAAPVTPCRITARGKTNPIPIFTEKDKVDDNRSRGKELFALGGGGGMLEMLRRIVFPTLIAILHPAAFARADELKTYTSKEGKFSVLWPDEPKITQAKHPKTGTVKTRYEIESPGPGIELLSLDVAELPPEEVKKNGLDGTLKVFKETTITGLKATIVSEEKVTIGKAKHEGRDIVFQLPDMKTRVRLRACLVGNRFYAMTLMGPKDAQEGKLAGRVFESFTPTQ